MIDLYFECETMISIAYNVRGWDGWPSFKGLNFSEIGERFADALGRYSPDIITFSEAPLCSITNIIADKLGMNIFVFPSSWSWHGVLLTKYKVLDVKAFSFDRDYWSRDLFSRHWGRCIIETEFGKVVLHSLHLFPDPSSQRHRDEVLEVLKILRRDIDLGYPILLQGDLNHEPIHESYKRWLEIGLIDLFTEAGIGEENTFRSDNPSQRIDYIFTNNILVDHLIECRVLDIYPFTPGKDGVALSDHLPIIAIFK